MPYPDKELDANELIAGVINTFTLKVERYNGKIESELKATNSAIFADEMHITNVIFNLMDNAVKYKRPDADLQLTVKTWNEPGKLMISIQDNGIGIYDPAYAYEVAVIMHDGLVRMYGEAQENVYYYITTLNENYHMPAMPEGAEEGIRKGIYKLETIEGSKGKVQLLGSGSILRHVREAAQILAKDYGVGSDVYSVTSFTELARRTFWGISAVPQPGRCAAFLTAGRRTGQQKTHT